MLEWITMDRIAFLAFVPAFLGLIYCFLKTLGNVRPEKQRAINFLPFLILVPTSLLQPDGKRWLRNVYGLAVFCIAMLFMMFEFAEKTTQ